MKNLYILLILFLFTSCEKYITECPTVTLSGKYVISKVRIQSVDQNTTKDSTLYTGDLCVTHMPAPFDSFYVDDFKLHMDNASISFPFYGVIQSRDRYVTTTTYEVRNCSRYYVGDLRFTYTYKNVTPTLTFFIEDDGLEHVQIKTKGVWPYGKWGEDVMYTFFLTRTGP